VILNPNSSTVAVSFNSTN